jgi:hypothetical protein
MGTIQVFHISILPTDKGLHDSACMNFNHDESEYGKKRGDQDLQPPNPRDGFIEAMSGKQENDTGGK